MIRAFLRPLFLLLIASFICFAYSKTENRCSILAAVTQKNHRIRIPVVREPVAPPQVNQTFTVSIADKGAIPGDSSDDAPAFRQAFQELGGEGGSGGTILVPPGR